MQKAWKFPYLNEKKQKVSAFLFHFSGVERTVIQITSILMQLFIWDIIVTFNEQIIEYAIEGK